MNYRNTLILLLFLPCRAARLPAGGSPPGPCEVSPLVSYSGEVRRNTAQSRSSRPELSSAMFSVLVTSSCSAALLWPTVVSLLSACLSHFQPTLSGSSEELFILGPGVKVRALAGASGLVRVRVNLASCRWAWKSWVLLRVPPW